MRLALITETFPPEVNGVARTLGRWVDTFRARGHEVFVIRPRQPGESRGPGLVYGRPLPFYRQVRVGVASPSRLATLLQSARPDLVHIATEGPLGLSALLAARWLHLPVASSFHTNFDHYASHYGFFGAERLGFAYLRWFHNRTRVTLVPSRATRDRLLADGIRRVEIWSRGVDADAFHPRHRDDSAAPFARAAGRRRAARLRWPARPGEESCQPGERVRRSTSAEGRTRATRTRRLGPLAEGLVAKDAARVFSSPENSAVARCRAGTPAAISSRSPR